MSKRPTRKSTNKANRRKQAKNQAGFHYSHLEPRHLLATDLGLNITGSTKGTQSDVIDPNMVGDIGPTHYIESIVDKIAIFDRNTGNRTLFKSPTQFWVDIGGIVSSTITNTQVVFDRMANRWFMLGEGDGAGNWLYLAISNNANPMQGWQATRFVGDSTGIRHNGQLAIAVDADALLITSRNTTSVIGFPLSVSIFSIPKADLYQASPTITNMSRFENLSPNTFGDYLRPSFSYEASDGKAMVLGSRGSNKITTTINNVSAAGATLSAPKLIDFNPSNLIVDNNDFALGSKGPLAEQTEIQPGNIPIFIETAFNLPAPANADIFSNPYDYKGGLWFVQEGMVQYTGGTTRGIWYYEVDKATNQLLQGGVVPTPAGSNPWDWFMYNPGFSINNYGLLQVNYTISSSELEVVPTAASSVAQSVYGVAIYNPIFDLIGFSNEEPGKEGKNTQFEGPFFIQDGLEIYQNNPGQISSWSWRASSGWDPVNYNRFWASTQWGNTVSRWSTQISQLIPTDLTVEITADENDNIFVLRRKAGSPELMEIEIDGVVTDVLPYEPIGKLVLNGYDGDDILMLDYTNGNPVPLGGFEFNGMRGADRLETNNPAGSTFIVDSFYRNIYGQSGDGSGTYDGISGFTGVEDLHGGEGPDTFEVTDVWQLDPIYIQLSQGHLAGSMVGKGGDDTFMFSETGWIGDSVDGGSGFNTISFRDRGAGGPLVRSDYPVAVQLVGAAEFGGFDGFTPIGDGFQLAIGDNPDQNGDLFRNIHFIRGADTSFDDVRGIDQQAFVFVDDENSYYEAGGERLGFFEINAISGSQFDDHFVGIRNSVDPLHLNGLAGNDLYDFSSDAPTNTGSTADLGLLLFANGGSGDNVMNISNSGGQAVNALILQNRISGLGEIAYNAAGGTFALNVWASEFADHVDLHSFFFTNTLNLHLLGGNDTMSIQDLSKATVNVFGGLGDDVYTIERIQGIDLRNLNLFDSIGSERDRVQLAGTILDETFNITQSTFADLNIFYEGIEWFGVESRGGNDTINVQTIDYEFYINGEDGNDIINISSDAPTNLGSIEGYLMPLTIEGGAGRNELRISNHSGSGKNVVVTNSTITGFLPSVVNYASTGGTFGLISGIGGILLVGSNAGADTFNIMSLNADDSLRVRAGGGDDVLMAQAGALGNIQFDGELGSDRFDVYYVGSGARRVVVNDDLGAPATGRLNLYGTDLVDTVVVAGAHATRNSEDVQINAPLSYFGISTGLADDVVLSSWSTGIATFKVMGGVGDDRVTLQAGAIETLNIVSGDVGDDIITVRDLVNGRVEADGEEGADRYNIFVQASGTRVVNTRDSGTNAADMDVTAITGQATDEKFAIRAGVVAAEDQRVLYNANTERLNLKAFTGADTVDMYSSNAATTYVQGGLGDDRFTVHATSGAKQLTIDGNDGNDDYLILRTAEETSVLARGGNGDDRFNIGSTAEDNSGNLGYIRGRVTVQGNASTLGGEDRLYVNDFNVNTPYNYLVAPTMIRSIAGPNGLSRPQFAGINFDSTLEFARLDGTIAANFFSVKPSKSTRFYIDGNLPSPIVGSGDYIFLQTTANDGHQLHITDAPRGRGYWDFTDGTKEVRFEEIETTFAGPIVSASPLFNGGGFGPQMMRAASSNGSQSFAPMSIGFDSLAGAIDLDSNDDFDPLAILVEGAGQETADEILGSIVGGLDFDA
ncbi:MAG: hypothetical protein R3C03_11270 [Pirellulaceae bacterium]